MPPGARWRARSRAMRRSGRARIFPNTMSYGPDFRTETVAPAIGEHRPGQVSHAIAPRVLPCHPHRPWLDVGRQHWPAQGFRRRHRENPRSGAQIEDPVADPTPQPWNNAPTPSDNRASSHAPRSRKPGPHPGPGDPANWRRALQMGAADRERPADQLFGERCPGPSSSHPSADLAGMHALPAIAVTPVTTAAASRQRAGQFIVSRSPSRGSPRAASRRWRDRGKSRQFRTRCQALPSAGFQRRVRHGQADAAFEPRG